MCGIAIILGEKNPDKIHEMMDKMKHRGPDEDGVFFSDNISMGHVRLSIIDLKTGKQPIFNETKDKCIILNGEIYNFKILFDRLQGKHIFNTKTDTEVILHLYEEYGTGCVDFLEGMFCFAVYDNGEIFIARDRIGIKPLYYGYQGKNIYFASEYKALNDCVSIEEFPPGYIYTSKNGFSKYYSLPEMSDRNINLNIEIIKEKINLELTKAVEKRMVSDVPVGVFLSGGLDSSIIAAIMKRFSDSLYTFATGIKDSPDLLAARKIADFLGTKHYEYVYDEKEMLKSLPEVIYHLESFDAPLVRSSIPCYFVSKLASDYVKVILTGEGADELFSGYHYLKNFDLDNINRELFRITANLHNSNLQRTDRMTMAHSVEARVPFLDPKFINLMFEVPPNLKIQDKNNIGKVLLRKSFEGYLPEEILWRRKAKFSEGAGSSDIIRNYIETRIQDDELFSERVKSPLEIRSKEELLYLRIFNNYYNYVDPVKVLGRTKDYNI